MSAEVLVLAIGAMVSPAIFAAVLLILTRPRPRSLLFAYFLGALLISVGLGIGIVTGLKASGILNGSIVSPSLELAVGGLALLIAWVLGTGRTPKRIEERREQHKESDKDPWSDRLLSRGSVPLAFLIGFVMNLPGGFYLIALKDMADSNPAFADATVRILAFNLVMLVPIEVPLIGFIVAPDRTEALAQRLGEWIDAHGRQLVIGTAVLMGLYLIVSGLSRIV